MIHPSQALLEQRCLATPGLVRTLSLAALEPAAAILKRAASIVCTGIGASEGPARLLASSLNGPERPARFFPLSALLLGDHRDGVAAESVLVVFSQKLSPNARLALEAAGAFSRTIVICGRDGALEQRLQELPANVSVIRHFPEDESGFLLRVTGPAVSSAVALTLGALVRGKLAPGEIAERLRRGADAMDRRLRTPFSAVDLLEKPPAFLVLGLDGVERAHLPRWTLLECPDVQDPPVWDLLSFAHGPFQNIHEKPRTLITLHSAGELFVRPLLDRLLDMLRQTAHTYLDLPSELPRPWSILEHLAGVHRLVLDHVGKYPRDLWKWPGQGQDGPLYDLAMREAVEP